MTQQTLAQRADRYALYQATVQEPREDLRVFAQVYREVNGREPVRLREDFCGTGAVSAAWVAARKAREARGVDLDPEPLAWGREHNLAALTAEQRARVRLLAEDVRSVSAWKADVEVAGNFSFYIFHARADLLVYLQAARRNLRPGGVLLLQMMGGPDVLTDERWERRRFKGCTYYWEQSRFDPVANFALFHIHYEFRDGSILHRAFEYPWRLWSIPEVRDALADAGFKDSAVYWAGTSRKTGGSNGRYTRRESVPAEPAWLAWVAGIR